MKDFVIVVQGPSVYVEQVKNALSGFDIIFSTWTGEENKYNQNDIAIFNEIPSYNGPANLNLQKISTSSGLHKAKELGYKKALKLRSDLIPANVNKFMKLLDNEDLNFLCWNCHEVYPGCSGYLVDYLMSGSIDHLIKLWDIKNMDWCVVPEIHLTHQYIETLIDLVDIRYFLNNLNQNNDLHWIKKQIMLSSYQPNNIYDRYVEYNFVENKERLKENYISFLSNKDKIL